MDRIPPDWANLIAHDDAQYGDAMTRDRRAKLSRAQIEEIVASAEPQKVLAARYGVDQSRISRIKRREGATGGE